MGPSKNKSLVDVACGTGDIGKLYLDNTNINNHITCIDPNRGMISKGKEKLKNYKNIKWIISSAEKLPLKSNSFDFYVLCAFRPDAGGRPQSEFGRIRTAVSNVKKSNSNRKS